MLLRAPNHRLLHTITRWPTLSAPVHSHHTRSHLTRLLADQVLTEPIPSLRHQPALPASAWVWAILEPLTSTVHRVVQFRQVNYSVCREPSQMLIVFAATPPANSQGMQYQQTSQAPYNSQYYSAPGSYGQYSHQPAMSRGYAPIQQSPGGVKTEMGPPARAGAESEHADSKPHDGYSSQHDAEGEHEGEYTHSASYGARRPLYTPNPNVMPGPVHSDPSHVSPEMTHSPHQNGTHGSSTPRTTSTYTGYSTTPRQSQLPASNLNYVMSNDTRAGAANGPDPAYQSGYQAAPQYPVNGAMHSSKRGRDEDQEDPYGRPISASGDASIKRQRTDPGVGMARPISQPQSAKVGGMRR